MVLRVRLSVLLAPLMLDGRAARNKLTKDCQSMPNVVLGKKNKRLSASINAKVVSPA